MFQVFITSSAKKHAKRLPREVREEAVMLCENYIAKHPFDSEKLQRPLHECRSFHFKLNNVYYRIAYRIIEDAQRIDVILISSRENFYQKLKRTLKL
ncbi:type II toxin-antitoxin system RelE/ParE family toxin [Patescibacteria group bacterium]|nr:type II toxin-antitoxin system RelE/ParE family toxin [Patescibacteria group bacterium]MBU1349984.1 type II toxin-antitoxin system RelE/ParE family toxin [Patescibacteria group bacterium]MBU1421478.1 type II toxin-antitoxin system RelE/ParE family toxin [Patescibacteria group bacterium]MBU2416204.1 type II toxin-antitoxin system RelE/ParE family toxin [Patescibacteria group bacterium]MBU2456754.1 type II toxin-antitoxin system RelE/ParE family toxin [Patescibacteria group bacterium]